jgi:hypothetical protein
MGCVYGWRLQFVAQRASRSTYLGVARSKPEDAYRFLTRQNPHRSASFPWRHKKGHPAMSFVRAAASAAIVTLLSAACATAKPIATSAETNLRKGPGTDSEVLTLVPKGTTVEVGKCTNGWCAASLNGQDGYVIARNVGLAPRRRRPGSDVYEEEVVAGPAYGPPGYYRPYPYYGYRPYYGYYGYGWGYRGWGWRW